MSKILFTITLHEDDSKIRKKLPRPEKAIRSKKAYRRKEKHYKDFREGWGKSPALSICTAWLFSGNFPFRTSAKLRHLTALCLIPRLSQGKLTPSP